MPPLLKKVAFVTGASRGIGKGLEQAMGAAGAPVYVTGRSEFPSNATVRLPGTIHETAVLVTQAGGLGIAMRCDHNDGVQHRLGNFPQYNKNYFALFNSHDCDGAPLLGSPLSILI